MVNILGLEKMNAVLATDASDASCHEKVAFST
jgi:hypothetical protein